MLASHQLQLDVLAANDPLVQEITRAGNNGKYPHVSSYELPEKCLGNPDGCCPTWKRFSKTWAHPLHSMVSRSGSFPPALPYYFIQHYSSEGDIVFDPFCGRGTTLLEAVLNKRVGVGSDLAPEAVIISKAKIISVTLEEVRDYVLQIPIIYRSLDDVPEQVHTFFHPTTLAQILSVRDYLVQDMRNGDTSCQNIATFVMGCLLGILHGHSKMSLSIPSSHSHAMAPRYVQRYAEEYNLEKPIRDIKECLILKSQAVLARGSAPPNQANIYQSTAEQYGFNETGWLNENVQLIVTSPPYMAAQTYAKDNWLRLWLLGYDYREVRKTLIETENLEKYSRKISTCLEQMLLVLKPGGKAFIVVGDVFKRYRNGEKKRINTADLIAELAETLTSPLTRGRFQVNLIIDDTIPGTSRYYSMLLKDGKSAWSHDGTGTGVRIDRILCLTKV